MKKTLLAVVAATSLFTLGACSSGDDTPVVTTSAGDVTKEELYDSMKDYLGEDMLYQLVVEKVLSEEFEVTDEEVDEELQTLKDQYGDYFETALESAGKTEDQLKDEIYFVKLREKAARSEVEVTEKEIEAAYAERKPEIQASHILVETEDEAKAILKKINAGEDFATLAKEYSTDEASAKEGGDLGYFGSGDMVEAFETAAYALKKGEVSEIVQTDYGYHIIKVTDIKELESLEDLHDEIKEELIEEKLTSTFITRVVTDKLNEANVKVKDSDLKDTFKNAEEELEATEAEETESTESTDSTETEE